MSIKQIILRQYRDKVNTARSKVKDLLFPAEGWLCTTRKALGMSAAQLARRMGKTRALVSNTEKAELNGGVTLKTMQKMAEAMDCRFVYAVVPKVDVELVLRTRARKIARRLVLETNQHMLLEQQALSKQQLDYEVERLTEEMLKNLPADFWEDE